MANWFILDGEASAAFTTDDLRLIGLAAFLSPLMIPIGYDDANGRSSWAFQLPFSISNLTGTSAHIDAGTAMYDSSCQKVVESFDRPVAVKGYLAIAVIDDGSSDDGSLRNDFDDYLLFKFRGSGTNTAHVYVGLVNSTKSQVYTPLAGATTVAYLDPVAILEHDFQDRAVAAVQHMQIGAFKISPLRKNIGRIGGRGPSGGASFSG
jgi:hypothetical protein